MAFRADASAINGLGHVKRCLSLARTLRDMSFATCMVSRDLGVDVRCMAKRAGIEYVALDAFRTIQQEATVGDSPDADAMDTAAALAGWGATHVLVDHYLLDARWHRRVRQSLGVQVVAIDDLADRELAADLLVDPNVCVNPAEKYRGRIRADTRILAGPRFALLAPEYADAAPCAPATPVRSVGICMGGADAAGLSSVALIAVREHAEFAGAVEIATTSANPHLADLRELCLRFPDTSLTVDAQDLSAFFARHDLQIGAGGGSAWERCRIGAPTLALLAAANQHVVIAELARLAVVATPEPMGALDAPTIGRAVAALIADGSRRLALGAAGRHLVDGRGAQRVALVMAAPLMAVRKARLDDGAFMHEWRNSPATRAVSHDSRKIGFGEHMQWLERSLESPERVLLVACIGPVAVGVIRFDLSPDGIALVSLYLDPGLHGLSLGVRMLEAGECYVIDQGLACAGFAATVVDTNAVSRKLFLKAGYISSDGRLFKHRLAQQAGESHS